MRKIYTAILLIMTAVSFTAFGNQKVDGKKILIAYFSVPENEKNNGIDGIGSASMQFADGKLVGNTQLMAMMIQKKTGGDIFEIKTKAPYPRDHKTLVDQADGERERGFKPELASMIDNIDEYDTVFIGYPIWWYGFPMPMYTFFEENDFSGKKVIPFSTHGGSGFTGTIEEMAKLQPRAQVEENGLTISRNRVSGMEREVNTWLENLGF